MVPSVGESARNIAVPAWHSDRQYYRLADFWCSHYLLGLGPGRMAMAPDPLGRASRCPWHRVLVHPHGPAGPGPMADRLREDLACGSALGREGSHREKASPHT